MRVYTMDKNIVFIIAVKKDGQLKSEYEIGIEIFGEGGVKKMM